MVIQDEKGILNESSYTNQNNPTSIQNVSKWEPEILLADHNEDSYLSNPMDPLKTPKQQKIQNPGEVKRWASVVKSTKEHQKADKPSKSDDQIQNTTKTPEIIDSVLNLLPKNLEAQRGFIVSQNTSYLCTPCSREFDSVNSIANHLKTRKHEDSIISHLKDKLPVQLESIMEYVSFFGFKLCCNLCHCSIAMSSYNPYETIVNIVGHNASKMHITQKVTCENYSGDLTGIGDFVMSAMFEGFQQKMTICTQSNELEILENQKKLVVEMKSRVLELSKHVEVPANQPIVHNKQSRLKDLLGCIPSGLTHIDCIVENDKGSITCLICNRVVPPSSQNLYSHLNGSNHKKNKDKSITKFANENSKEKKSPDCTELKNFIDAYDIEIVKKVPTCLKSLSKEQPKDHITPSKDFDNNFEQIMMHNSLFSKNKNYLVVNVDGRNSYCKLCRTLIPLTNDLSTLEYSLVEHFQKEKHALKLSCTVLESIKKASRIGSGRVSRSLFDFSEEDFKQEYNMDDVATNHGSSKEDKELSIQLEDQPCAGAPHRNQNEDDSTEVIPEQGSKIVRSVMVERERDEAVLVRREKQISYGKNTAGYSSYCRQVPKRQRGARDPVTPPRHIKCSRRAWDGMVRIWRRKLHAWDPPQPPTLDSSSWLVPLPDN